MRGPSPAAPAGRALVGALFCGLLAGCGDIILDPIDDDPPSGPYRRLFVNDRAANDSLPPAIAESGIQFVLQPDKPYELRVEGGAGSGGRLQVFRIDNGRVRKHSEIVPFDAGDAMVFDLSSSLARAQHFVARMRSDAPASAYRDVRLFSLHTGEPDTIRVRLIFVNRLSGLEDAAGKQAFAGEFFARLARIYAGFSLPILGSMEIAGDGGGFTDVSLENQYVALPGTRQEGHLHLYLVESISDDGSRGFGEAGPQGIYLGFAPREAQDLYWERASRVILSNQLRDAGRLATTAAHEMGHFFGLRHTVSTEIDLSFDKDHSNLEDGFADTRTCHLGFDVAMADLPAAGALCLRVSAISCPRACDLDNLMHPFECSDVDQVELSAEQLAFLRRNVALYQ